MGYNFQKKDEKDMKGKPEEKGDPADALKGKMPLKSKFKAMIKKKGAKPMPGGKC